MRWTVRLSEVKALSPLIIAVTLFESTSGFTFKSTTCSTICSPADILIGDWWLRR